MLMCSVHFNHSHLSRLMSLGHVVLFIRYFVKNFALTFINGTFSFHVLFTVIVISRCYAGVNGIAGRPDFT